MEHLHYIKLQLESISTQLKQLYYIQLRPTLTAEEAALYLNISKSTLYKHTCSNKITYYKNEGGKHLSFMREDLDSWLKSRKVPSNTELKSDNTITNPVKLNQR